MEDAWHEHVCKLTLQQIRSPDACREHLHSFPRAIVSQGFALTPLASNDDVQDVITTFLRSPDYMVPPAASMRVLTDTERAFHMGVMLKEIGEMVKAAAQDGRKQTGLMDPRENGPDKDVLQSRRNFTADPSWLAELRAVLCQEGYRVLEEQVLAGHGWQSVKTGKFSLHW